MSENNKTKKILLTILAVVVIAALGLVVYQYSGYKAGTKVQEEAGTEESVEGAGTEESKTEEGAGKNLASPEETTQPDVEISTIMNEAIQTHDISLCERIESEDIKETCKTEAGAATE